MKKKKIKESKQVKNSASKDEHPAPSAPVDESFLKIIPLRPSSG